MRENTGWGAENVVKKFQTKSKRILLIDKRIEI